MSDAAAHPADPSVAVLDHGSDGEPGPDVVLIRPRDIGSVPPGAPVQDPLGVGFLTAVLRQRGFRVVVLDAHALGLDDQGLVDCVRALSPRLVGLSLHAFADYPHCVAISRGLRALDPRPYCVWGGEHATFNSERILTQHPEVDAVVLSEGEETICELASRVAAARGGPSTGQPAPGGAKLAEIAVRTAPTDPDAVLGALTRDAAGRIVHGGFRHAVEDLDSLPLASKDSVEMALATGKRVTLSILTGRGCTHRCTFCTAHEFMRLGGGGVWRRRSPAAVADEVQRLSVRYMHNPLTHPVLQFQDVIFLGTSPAAKRWAAEYVDEVERRGLKVPFYCMTRADSILANRDLLQRLVSAGLWSVEVGIESGVDRILQQYNKRNSAHENEEAVQLLRANGITFDASGFIMFDPSMTLDELRTNAKYLQRFGAATWDFFVTRLQLYPGTQLRDEMIRKGLFTREDDIGCTDDYVFEDPLVGLVADHAYYYDMSIRSLDLALRDAKAELANRQRRGIDATGSALARAVDLTHETYCGHLLDLADHAKAGSLARESAQLIGTFMHRVAVLHELLRELLQLERQEGMLEALAA